MLSFLLFFLFMVAAPIACGGGILCVLYDIVLFTISSFTIISLRKRERTVLLLN